MMNGVVENGFVKIFMKSYQKNISNINKLPINYIFA